MPKSLPLGSFNNEPIGLAIEAMPLNCRITENECDEVSMAKTEPEVPGYSPGDCPPEAATP